MLAYWDYIGTGNTAQERFLIAEPEHQKIVATEVLWNLLVKEGKTEEVRYRSFYEVLAKAPKNGDLEMGKLNNPPPHMEDLPFRY